MIALKSTSISKELDSKYQTLRQTPRVTMDTPPSSHKLAEHWASLDWHSEGRGFDSYHGQTHLQLARCG